MCCCDFYDSKHLSGSVPFGCVLVVLLHSFQHLVVFYLLCFVILGFIIHVLMRLVCSSVTHPLLPSQCFPVILWRDAHFHWLPVSPVTAAATSPVCVYHGLCDLQFIKPHAVLWSLCSGSIKLWRKREIDILLWNPQQKRPALAVFLLFWVVFFFSIGSQIMSSKPLIERVKHVEHFNNPSSSLTGWSFLFSNPSGFLFIYFFFGS